MKRKTALKPNEIKAGDMLLFKERKRVRSGKDVFVFEAGSRFKVEHVALLIYTLRSLSDKAILYVSREAGDLDAGHYLYWHEHLVK